MELHFSLTPLLAVWGAVVSTVALVWNIVRGALESTKVRVEAMIAKDTRDPFGPEFLTVRITNVRGSTVMIQGLASEDARKDKEGRVRSLVLNALTLPKMLEPKAYTVEVIRDFAFIRPGTKRLYVWDSTGKHWLLPNKRLKELTARAVEQGLV